MTRDNDLNGLERYERFLDAQRFESKEPAAPMSRDNPSAPMSDIAAELERLVAIAKDGPHKFSRQQSTGDVTACLRGNIDTIIAALRAVGEVESVLNSAPRNVHTSDLIDKLRRAIAGSAT